MPDQPKSNVPKSTSGTKPEAKASDDTKASSAPKDEKPPAPKAEGDVTIVQGDVTIVQLVRGDEPAPTPKKPPPEPPDADVTTLKKAKTPGKKRDPGESSKGDKK